MKPILTLVWVTAVLAINGQVDAGLSSSATSVEDSGTPTSTSSGNLDAIIMTATPSVTAQLTAILPSQAALPPAQAWCPSQIFCAGKVR
jgi:alpha,alpha-trehalase